LNVATNVFVPVWKNLQLKCGADEEAVVNFINVTRANFSFACPFGSFFYVHVTRKKLPKWCSYEKFVRLTLMKLTPCGFRGKLSLSLAFQLFYSYFGILHNLATHDYCSWEKKHRGKQKVGMFVVGKQNERERQK